MISDFGYILQWWIVFAIIGIIFLPTTSFLFAKFIDKGYIFSKIFGIGIVGYVIFVLATFHIAPFSLWTLIVVLLVSAIINGLIIYTLKLSQILKECIPFAIVEETLFLLGIILWVFVRGHEPSINGLEKFMDFGFINSILRAEYFPAKDMWFAPLSINYYYFGHYLTALLTKLSGLPSFITYNLMLATLFSLTFSQSFSIGLNLVFSLHKKMHPAVISGILAGMLTALSGNLHTIYAFFTAYTGDNPKPFWELAFKPLTLFSNNYWYPNATRFIPYTIHEFPLYSFVVADLHGHVLDIPFVLFMIALLYSLLIQKKLQYPYLILIALFLSMMYMTSAWDGAIYLLLAAMVIFYYQYTVIIHNKKSHTKNFVSKIFSATFSTIPKTILLAVGFIIFSFPFNMHFKPFVSGIGVMCAPTMLTTITPDTKIIGKFVSDTGHLGPFLFEANHCTHSGLYMLLILYGFFFVFAGYFIYRILRNKNLLKHNENIFVGILIFLSVFLIILPELIYLKDIYPQHYRANTMFKLVYQSFMMLSLVSAYVIVAYVKPSKNYLLYAITILLVSLVMLYPRFAVFSYYGDLVSYQGLNGVSYIKDRLAGDDAAITWINKNIHGQPIILEAQSDSYTDYGRISANTGLPTVLGWTVHEWLWRGTYDIPAPRIEDIRKMYESESIDETKALLKKYKVMYVYVGGLERQKYPNIVAQKFKSLGKIVYSNNSVTIYQLQ